MKFLSSEEFCELVTKKPSWAKGITERTDVIGNVHLRDHKITHLSKMLHFRDCAFFVSCDDLKLATGNFYAGCNFYGSGIQAIKCIQVLGNIPGRHWGAIFDKCGSLKVATGDYKWPISFRESGVEEIVDLTVTNPSEFGECVSFENCTKLKVADGNYTHSPTSSTHPDLRGDLRLDFSGSGIDSINLKGDYGTVFFNGCKNLKIGRGRYKSVDFSGSGVEEFLEFKAKYVHLYQCQNLKMLPPCDHIEIEEDRIKVTPAIPEKIELIQRG